MIKILHRLSLCAGLLCLYVPVFSQVNVTNDGGVISSPNVNGYKYENFPKLIDNYPTSKYLFESGSFTVTYKTAHPSLVTQYAVTSAYDEPNRDPMNWVLQGSKDGVNWVMLDGKYQQFFSSRTERKVFTIATPDTFSHYQLIAFATIVGRYIQLAEWELLAPVTVAAPASPVATMLAGQRVKVGWADKSSDETGFAIDRSSDGQNYSVAAIVPPNTKLWIDSNLAANQQYTYRVRALSPIGASKATATVLIRTDNGPSYTDITEYKEGQLTSQWDYAGENGLPKAIDNSPNTFLNIYGYTGFLQHYLPGGAVLKQYAITAMTHSAGNDPKSWTFEGSNDGSNWTELNRQTDQLFSRGQRRVYAFTNNTSYKYHRLSITENAGWWGTYIAEFELLGKGRGTIAKDKPVAPQGFYVNNASPYQVILNWTDVADNETGYRLERSKDSVRWNTVNDLNPGSTQFYSRNLEPNTTYFYRLSSYNNYGRSPYLYATASTPAAGAELHIQEDWDVHTQAITRVHDNKDVAIYFDKDVPYGTNWMFSEFTTAWKYIKKNYGTFADPKLYVVLHEDKYGGGHPATVFDYGHHYRNMIDLGGGWTNRNDWNIGAPVHEIGHIVEGSAKDVKESPAFGIWGDSKWCEIFNYDVYKRVGWKKDADDVYRQMQTNADVYPRPGTYWFRDWFYPLYTNGDSSVTLNRYFELLRDYFPQHNGHYTREMNMGEFIHFWSGAAGYNLKAQADTAFGWNEEYQLQFNQARIDFPFTYPEQCRPKPQPPKNWDDVKEYLTALWPNPASGTIYFNGPDESKLYTVDVYTLAGVKVLTTKASGKNAPLNISALNTGIYLFAVSDKGSVVFTRKILVTKQSSVIKY